MNEKPTPENDSLEATLEEQKLLRQLRDNPHMADQFKAIADRFEQEIANGMDAHQAEAALIESLRELGKSIMHQWAQNTQRDIIQQSPMLQKHSKKLHWHTTFGLIGIIAPVMRDGRRGSLHQPFRDFAKVT